VYAGELPVSEVLAVFQSATPEAQRAVQQLATGARAVAVGSTPGLLLLLTRAQDGAATRGAHNAWLHRVFDSANARASLLSW
jgi:hypothetical protein